VLNKDKLVSAFFGTYLFSHWKKKFLRTQKAHIFAETLLEISKIWGIFANFQYLKDSNMCLMCAVQQIFSPCEKTVPLKYMIAENFHYPIKIEDF